MTIADQIFSPWRVKRILDEDDKQTRSDSIALIQTSVATNDRTQQDLDSEAVKLKSQLAAELAAFQRHIQSKDAAFQISVPDFTGNTRLRDLRRRLDLAAKPSDQNASELAKAPRSTIDTWIEVNSRSIENRAALKQLRTALADAQLGLVARVLGVADAAQIKANERERVLDLIDEIKSLNGTNSSSFYFFRSFLYFPHEVILFVIVLSGGVLGRSLQLLRATIVDDALIATRISILDPLFGAMVALVLYVVVKAGVLIAVDPRVSGGISADLNPFLVAFMGIVAGLLSDQVVDRVRVAAQDWLRGSASENRERWLISSNDRKLDQREWLAFFPQDAHRIDDWLSGKKPVPPERQPTLALWLKLPQHNLFTDISPPPSDAL